MHCEWQTNPVCLCRQRELAKYFRYNSYIPYFLQTRGADFGDGSVYITYRNVRTLVSRHPSTELTHAGNGHLASHPERRRHPGRLPRRLDGRAALPRAQRHARDLDQYVPAPTLHTLFVTVPLTTRARRSPDGGVPAREHDRAHVRRAARLELRLQPREQRHVGRALRRHPRAVPREGPRDGKLRRRAWGSDLQPFRESRPVLELVCVESLMWCACV